MIVINLFVTDNVQHNHSEKSRCKEKFDFEGLLNVNVVLLVIFIIKELYVNFICLSLNAIEYTSYVLNLKKRVYTAPELVSKPEKNIYMHVVRDLKNEIKGSNILEKNFFIFYARGHYLLKRNISVVGTIRNNTRKLPN